jgi:hypothetical protein
MFPRLQTFVRRYVQETPGAVKDYLTFGCQTVVVLWVLDDEIEDLRQQLHTQRKNHLQ